MPPTSVNIFEEGAEVESFKIVDGGVFDRKGLIEYMIDKPSQYLGSSGCRNIRDVESDLKAVCWRRSVLILVTDPVNYLPANRREPQRNPTDSCQLGISLFPRKFCSFPV